MGKEFAHSIDPGFYAATPPGEAMRVILSRAATTQDGQKRKVVMTNDVRRAYFNASVTREVYVEIPAEDKSPEDGDVVGRLNLCLYSTRDAAHRSQEIVSEHLEAIGFHRGTAHPAVLCHEEKDVATLVHGDDYMSSGHIEDMRWLETELCKRFEIKTQIIRHEEGCTSGGKILNRAVRAAESGFELEADPRHDELIVEELGLTNAKGAATAGVDETDTEDKELLTGEDMFRYRSLAAQANHLAIDRPDLLFACKELCCQMSKPTKQAWVS